MWPILLQKEHCVKEDMLEFINNENYNHNLQSQLVPTWKRRQTLEEEYETEGGPSQPKLKSKKQCSKQGQGGPTSLVEKAQSCSSDKKGGRQG